MIVICDRCASQFQLDEAKVPAGGTKVRCSRCQHAFVVPCPETAAADLAETWVRETLGAEDDAPEQSEAESEAAEGESDWQFNEPVSPEPGLDAARDAVDDLLDGIDGESAAGPEAHDVSSDSLELEDESTGGLDLGEPLDLGDDGAIDRVEEPIDVASEVADPDEPSNWDLFDDEAATTYAEVPEPETAQTRVESETGPIGVGQPLVGLSGSSESDEESNWMARAGGAAGWVAVAVAVIASLIGGLSVDDAVVAAPATYSGAGFDLDEIRGRWVDNASTGPLYVVSGRMRRSEGSSPWDAIPLDLELIDASGTAIDGSRTALGPEIPSRYLHESSPEELRALQGNRARQFAAFAGTWLKFDAVVGAVPGAAKRFAFTASQPR